MGLIKRAERAAKREAAKERRKAAADRRKAAAAARRKAAAGTRSRGTGKAPRAAHDYRTCRDDECLKHACKAYREGVADCPLEHA